MSDGIDLPDLYTRLGKLEHGLQDVAKDVNNIFSLLRQTATKDDIKEAVLQVLVNPEDPERGVMARVSSLETDRRVVRRAGMAFIGSALLALCDVIWNRILGGGIHHG